MSAVRTLLAGAVALSVVACSGSDSATPDVTAPPPTPARVSTNTTAVGTTTVASQPTLPPTEVATTSTTVTEPPDETTSAPPETTRLLPEDLGTPVDRAPGVESPGEVIELVDMVWLFVPTASDPDDANVVVPLPEDAAIIAAYGRAMEALYGQVTQNPIPVEPTEAMQATFVDGGAKYSENVFAVRNAAGEYLGFPGDGDVLRPVVIADPRSDSEAFIFDCAISGSRYLDADGTLADGEVGGTIRAPLIIRVVQQDGVWLVDDIQDDERACS